MAPASSGSLGETQVPRAFPGLHVLIWRGGEGWEPPGLAQGYMGVTACSVMGPAHWGSHPPPPERDSGLLLCTVDLLNLLADPTRVQLLAPLYQCGREAQRGAISHPRPHGCLASEAGSEAGSEVGSEAGPGVCSWRGGSLPLFPPTQAEAVRVALMRRWVAPQWASCLARRGWANVAGGTYLGWRIRSPRQAQAVEGRSQRDSGPGGCAPLGVGLLWGLLCLPRP